MLEIGVQLTVASQRIVHIDQKEKRKGKGEKREKKTSAISKRSVGENLENTAQNRANVAGKK